MAAIHIDSVMGVYVLWSIISGSAAMMLPAVGLTIIGATAAAVVVTVPLAGVLVEAPWLLLAFFASASALSTYLLSDAQLTNGWRMVQIVSLTTFWIVVFDPAGFGWSMAYAVAGATVAVILVIVFDNVFWPDPAERKLLESVAASVETIRARLAVIGRAYVRSAPRGDPGLPRPMLAGAMSAHLDLLARAEREGLSPRRRALLLEAVGVTERLRLEIERLLSVASEAVPRQSRRLLAPELESVLGAIESALIHQLAELRSGFHEAQDTRSDSAEPIHAALESFNRRVSELLPDLTQHSSTDEMSNIGAFVLGLERIARLFIPAPIPLSDAVGKRNQATRAATTEAEATHIARPAAQAARKRYCLKLSAAVALAFVFGLATHRADLTTILWTVMIAGLPTYGASLRKMLLRFAGAALGGTIALAAIIATSPNFETVLSYMLICFVALLICAYLGQSGGGLAYVGNQAGTTFVLVFVSLSPSVREYEPLWRLWGIFIGIIAITVVFIGLWPEYAGSSLIPRLERMLEIILSLMPAGERTFTERQVEAIEKDSAQILSELLAVADDARIEGGRCGFDPDAVIDAVGTLRRIAHRLISVASGRDGLAMPKLDPGIENARARLQDALRAQFEICLDFVRRRAATGQTPQSQWNGAVVNGMLNELGEAISADNFAALSAWSVEQRRTLLSETEALRRMVVLTGELAEQLSRIALFVTARGRQFVPRAAAA